MGEVYSQVVVFAMAMALFPIPIIVSILLLPSPNGKRNLAFYIAGWLAGIFAVEALASLFISPYDATAAGATAAWIHWLRLVFGVALLYLAAQKTIKSIKTKSAAEKPKWMQAIDSFSSLKSFGTGFLLTGINPKNVLLIIGAATTVAGSGLPSDQQVIVWLLFTLTASLGVLLPVVLALALGKRSREVLAKVQAWMEKNNTVIVVILSAAIGIKLLVDALSGLWG